MLERRLRTVLTQEFACFPASMLNTSKMLVTSDSGECSTFGLWKHQYSLYITTHRYHTHTCTHNIWIQFKSKEFKKFYWPFYFLLDPSNHLYDRILSKMNICETIISRLKIFCVGKKDDSCVENKPNSA